MNTKKNFRILDAMLYVIVAFDDCLIKRHCIDALMGVEFKKPRIVTMPRDTSESFFYVCGLELCLFHSSFLPFFLVQLTSNIYTFADN